VVLILVIISQMKQFKNSTELNYFKKLLLGTTVLLFLSNLLSITLNFFRSEDGNLIDAARHIGILFSSTTTLLVAIVLYLIYKYRADGDK
jgi:CRISPR/Cas system CMR-associated protein Cmr5 small subunit